VETGISGNDFRENSLIVILAIIDLQNKNLAS
jgi:hypothetical protein